MRNAVIAVKCKRRDGVTAETRAQPESIASEARNKNAGKMRRWRRLSRTARQ